jgi:hypothetical protein
MFIITVQNGLHDKLHPQGFLGVPTGKNTEYYKLKSVQDAVSISHDQCH